jgi:hypothetical protein
MGAPEEQLGLSAIIRSYSRTCTYANFTPRRVPVVLLLAVKSSVLEHSLLEPLKAFDPLEFDGEPVEGEGGSLLADDVCETEPTEEPLRFGT